MSAILPGWIDLVLTGRARQEVQGLYESVLKRTPAGRLGVADDSPGTAVFLAATASDFIAGVAITVEGGFSGQG